MDNEEKIKYLRKAVAIKLDEKTNINSFSRDDFVEHYKKFPEKLYKYRTMTDYNKEALLNDYIFLAPADKMDDQFECSTTIDLDSIFNEESSTLTDVFIDELVDMIDEYPSNLSKEEAKEFAINLNSNKDVLDEDFIRQKIIDNPDSINQKPPKEVIEAFIKLVSAVWKGETTQKTVKDLFVGAKDAKHNQGIGSLAESNKSQVMWELYSNHYKGYCVEYDFRKSVDCLINTFPVIYGDKRKTELIRILVALCIEAFVYRISNKSIDVLDKTLDYIRLFVTKYEEWSFQKEWRILGEPRFKFRVPTPTALYIGKKCSKKDRDFLFGYARRKKIKLFLQKDNMSDLTIDFIRIM